MIGRRKSISGAPARFFSATAKWYAAGKPVRSDEEVERIFNEVCKPCTHFKKLKGDLGWCNLCKCSLNLGDTLNKIRWATEGCPDQPPRWTAEVEAPEIKQGVALTGKTVTHAPRRNESSIAIVGPATHEERVAHHYKMIEERRKRRQERQG